MHRSSSTINADVVRDVRGITGRGVVVAVLDSGIDAAHPHFMRHDNLVLEHGLGHRSFVFDDEDPLVDEFGHGTALASVVAGEYTPIRDPHAGALVLERSRDAVGKPTWAESSVARIAGMAPQARLLSLKVLRGDGTGDLMALIEALAYVNRINQGGAGRVIDVVLVGGGYTWNRELFPCGHSPACIEATRLVRSGVVVVAPSGDGKPATDRSAASAAALPYSVVDPGNAESVITVGATHRDLPEDYGVSSFSSRGPTHDGRLKPDLVAPGDRIVTAATGSRRAALQGSEWADRDVLYIDLSGTSVAAAHVAGVVAQLLAVRRSLGGRPDEVKRRLMSSAMDLGRVREAQGAGLVDALAALGLDSRLTEVPSRAVEPTRQYRDVEPAMGRSGEMRSRLNAAEVARGDSVGQLSVMFCYSRKDELLLAELKKHLAPLRREGKIDVWWDRRISPGADWRTEIDLKLSSADIIILLVSADFIDSDYAYDVEMRQAIERHNARTARVIPVIVRPADWKGTPFQDIQVLPRDAHPVISWGNPDEAWVDVARGVRNVVEELNAGGGTARSQ